MVEVIYVFILLEVKRNRSVRVDFGLGFTLSDFISILWCKEKVTCGKVCCEKLSSGGKVCGKKNGG